MNILEIIEKKKHKQELTKSEIEFVVNGVTNGSIADYQISSLLMAIYFNSMTDQEIINLTMAMVNSGDVVDLSKINKPTVDKHSTGGVGDKTSLVLTSILACFDLAVAKMSGRGLGHTGGTIDKLESIEGFSVEISEADFIKQVNEHSQAIIGQTANLVPADKKLYALRDVTATVDSIPLIAASIMSKKIASGASSIILDVKYGSGAFMKTEEDAEMLAQKLVMIGNGVGRKTMAVITSMQEPLGKAIGNVLEVEEAIAALNGNGPDDLMEVTETLACELLIANKKFNNEKAAKTAINEVLNNGQAYSKFVDFIKAQGATEVAIEKMAIAKEKAEIIAEESGYICEIDAESIGHAAALLGAGRMTKEDKIDVAVGIILNKKIGDFVNVEDVVCEVHYNNDVNLERVIEIISRSLKLSDNEVARPKLIAKVIR